MIQLKKLNIYSLILRLYGPLSKRFTDELYLYENSYRDLA